MDWNLVKDIAIITIAAIVAVLSYKVGRAKDVAPPLRGHREEEKRNETTHEEVQKDAGLHIEEHQEVGPREEEQKTERSRNKTWRIRRIPIHWDAERLRSFLENQCGNDQVHVDSLALEYHCRSQTATASGNGGRALSLEPSKLSKASETDNVKLKSDSHFNGITTLFNPSTDDHQLDIVAISGLAGHAYGSFRNKEDGHMWLRDSLPAYLTGETTKRPMARVMVYGYDSTVVNSKNFVNLSGLATTFRESLVAIQPRKPLIFVAHSLGGLIVKEAIIAMEGSNQQEHQELAKTIYGVVFFGVPHQGMDISSLVPMVGRGRSLQLVVSLDSVSSYMLDEQLKKFPRALEKGGHTEVFCFYETLESPTAVFDKETGQWSMSGPGAVLVTQFSATACQPARRGDEYVCALERTHSDLVKFKEDDNDCQIALEKIRWFCIRALSGRDRPVDSKFKFLMNYASNPDFVGRESLLQEIKETFGLVPGPTKQRSRLAIYGLGGIGKTQIAITFAYWVYRMWHQISVFWIHASSKERFRDAYAYVARECGIPGRDDPNRDVMSLVKEWLQQPDSGRWIMIIDDADDIDLFFPSQGQGLRHYLPQCDHGSILMTTRDREIGSMFMQGLPPLHIQPMSEDETCRLIHQALGHDKTTRKQALELSLLLEHLPLAIVQATAYINRKEMSIEKYCELVSRSDQNLVVYLGKEFEGNGRDTPSAVTTSWKISFDEIRDRDSLASEFMSLMCLFDRQAIPQKFIEHYHSIVSSRRETDELEWPDQVNDSLGTLVAFSFITPVSDESYDMHRLVQLVTRKWLMTTSRWDNFGAQALEVLCGACPAMEYEAACARKVMQLLPHAKAILNHRRMSQATNSSVQRLSRAKVLHTLGFYYYWQSQWDDAVENVTEARDLFMNELGADHEDTQQTVPLLLGTYNGQTRFDLAIRMGTREVKRSEKLLGPDHHITLKSTRELGVSFMNREMLDKAEALGLSIIERRKKVKGSNHLDTLESQRDLALVYRKQNRLSEADQLLQQLLRTYKSLGKHEDDVDTPHCLSAIAKIYFFQKRFSEAGQVLEQVIRGREEAIGAEHDDTVWAIHELSEVNIQLRNYQTALELEGRAWKLGASKAGEDHFKTLFYMWRYSVLLHILKRTDEALGVAQDCLARTERVAGPQSIQTQHLMRDIEIFKKAQVRGS